MLFKADKIVLPESSKDPLQLAIDLFFFVMDLNNKIIYTDDLFISDSKGKILRVSQSYESNYGIIRDEIIGKTVYELEEQGVFTPSVTAVVLRERTSITLTQKNRFDQEILTTGVPVFNARGELLLVICFNSVGNSQLINLQQNYSDLKTSLIKKNREIQALGLRAPASNSLLFNSNSQAMRMALSELQLAALTSANLLLTGETGVGKSVIAKAVHEMSERAGEHFVEVNCAVIHENLIESELFGYEKGAFTGASSQGKKGKIELANNGTLFLDEIAELPLNVQAKLLQVIQNKTFERVSGLRSVNVDFRLIAATNRDLEECVSDGTLRQDLYYRLNVLNVKIPPLRERKEDICSLAMQFLHRHNKTYNRQSFFSPTLLDFFEQYPWPGNIRQLENLIERMIITSPTPSLEISNLPQNMLPHASAIVGKSEGLGLETMLDQYEAQIINHSYHLHKTCAGVAKDLGISTATAFRKIHKYVKKQDDNIQ